MTPSQLWPGSYFGSVTGHLHEDGGGFWDLVFWDLGDFWIFFFTDLGPKKKHFSGSQNYIKFAFAPHGNWFNLTYTMFF